MYFFEQPSRIVFVVLTLAFMAGPVSSAMAESKLRTYTTQNINVNKRYVPPQKKICCEKILKSKTTVVVMPETEKTIPMPAPQQILLPPDDADYKLMSGDVLKIRVFGENDLSGKYTVAENGTMTIPLIGNVDVSGLMLEEVNERLIEKYKDGYLVNPDISIDLIKTKPFYILGAVINPGRYHYIPAMNALEAVAAGGGFTKNANNTYVEIVPVKTPNAIPVQKSLQDKIRPGDVVYVRER